MTTSLRHSRTAALRRGMPGTAALLCTAALAALTAAPTGAATTTWLTSTSGNWEDAARWSAGVPGPGDLAVVLGQTPGPGVPSTVLTINAATTVGAVQMNTASLNARAEFAVSGAFDWFQPAGVGGSLSFANASTIRLQGPTTLRGDGARGVNLTGRIEQSGSATWDGNTQSGGNELVVGITTGNSVWRNSGNFTDANSFDTALSGRGSFENDGSFLKSGAGVTRVSVDRFNNAGSVNVRAGTLRFENLNGVHDGRWQVDAGAVLDIVGGSPTLNGSIGGAGLVRLGGGTVAIEGFGHNAAVLLDGGTLAGSYQVFDGPFTWRSGALAGEGTTLLTGNVTIEGAAEKVLLGGRQVITYGQTTRTGGTLVIGAESTQTSFTNAGTFTDAAAAASIVGRGADNRFVNIGRYVKTGAGLTNVASSVTFDNQGTLEVQAGVLRLSGSMSTNAGVIDIAAGAGVLVISLSGATPLLNTGTLAGEGAIDAVSGGILNQGLVSPGRLSGASALGTLTVGDFAQAAEGVLSIELGAQNLHDRLVGTGSVTLGGTLALYDAGYLPLLGDSLSVLSFAQGVATTPFDDVVLHGFAPGVSFDVVYGANDVRLLVTAVPEPATVLLWLAGLAVVGQRLGRMGRPGQQRAGA